MFGTEEFKHTFPQWPIIGQVMPLSQTTINDLEIEYPPNNFGSNTLHQQKDCKMFGHDLRERVREQCDIARRALQTLGLERLSLGRTSLRVEHGSFSHNEITRSDRAVNSSPTLGDGWHMDGGVGRVLTTLFGPGTIYLGTAMEQQRLLLRNRVKVHRELHAKPNEVLITLGAGMHDLGLPATLHRAPEHNEMRIILLTQFNIDGEP